MKKAIRCNVSSTNVNKVTSAILNQNNVYDTAQSVASDLVAKLTKLPPRNGLRSIIDDLITTSMGYLFDAVYSDANNLPVCENCCYEKGCHFWANLYSYNEVMSHYDCEYAKIVRVSQLGNVTYLHLADNEIFHFIHNTELQNAPVNETDKCFEQGVGRIQMEAA